MIEVPYTHYFFYVLGARKIVRPDQFKGELTFTLDNYIKSQIHLQVVRQLFGRDIMKYKYALDYLEGDDSRLYEFSLVLRYFYQDHADMLCNIVRANFPDPPKVNVSTKVNRNVDLANTSVSMSDIKLELSDLLGGNLRDDAPFGLGIISKFDQKDIPTLQSSDLLALASICWYYGDTAKESVLVDILP